MYNVLYKREKIEISSNFVLHFNTKASYYIVHMHMYSITLLGSAVRPCHPATISSEWVVGTSISIVVQGVSSVHNKMI